MDSSKAVIQRFNREVIENRDMGAFAELVAADFVNHSAPPGVPSGPDGFAGFFTGMLHPALSDIRVHIHEQIEENGKVVTRKTIEATHTGAFFGQAASGKRIAISAMDIVVVRDGQYAEHWSCADLYGALAQIRGA
ncbi:ester cyclase [Chromobacterium vaccinii]|uniref:Ester cyclase n=1 Tax=Chromobacterium vaccinii TaxID=1108595 RepID=A0ABV0FB72_9NEIS